MPVYQRRTKKGEVRYDVVVTVDGIQKWARGHKRRKDAESVESDLKYQMAHGLLASAPERLTVAEYMLKRWLPFKESQLASRVSLLNYRSQANHIVNGLGSIRLGRLKPLDIQQFLAELALQGKGPTTVHIVYRRLSDALRQAVRWQLLARNPAEAIEPPRASRHRPPLLNNEMITRLLDAAKETPHGMLIYLAVMSGMRRGELIGLKWSQIDVAEGLLHIPTSKTEAGIRTVALGPATLEALRQHRLAQMRERVEKGAAWFEQDYVFTSSYGGATNIGTFRFHWKRIREAAGLPGLHFHDLRHVHASLLVRADVHPRVAQARLGHANSKTTMDVYSHVSPGDQAPAARAVEELLGPLL